MDASGPVSAFSTREVQELAHFLMVQLGFNEILVIPPYTDLFNNAQPE
jgi:hypothetical protein